MTLAGIYSDFRQLAGTYTSVWFICWGLRRRYELDVKLTNLEQAVRWVMVAAASALTLLPGAHLAAVRIGSFLIGTCFVAWPNLTHLIIPKPAPSTEPEQ